jgi:hypothetical protein
MECRGDDGGVQGVRVFFGNNSQEFVSLSGSYVSRTYVGGTAPGVLQTPIAGTNFLPVGEISELTAISTEFFAGQFIFRESGRQITLDLTANSNGVAGAACSVFGTATVVTL